MSIITRRNAVDRGAGMQRDTASCQCGGDFGAHIRIKSTQRQIAAVNEVGVHPKAVENTGKFKSNIASAIDHDTPRLCRQIERFIRRNGTVGESRHVGDLRCAAGCDQNMRCCQTAVTNRNAVRAGQSCPSLYQFCAGILQQIAINALQPVKFCILGGDQM